MTDRFTRTDVETSLGPISIRRGGSGPTVMLVHGAFVDGRLWDPVLEPLAERCDVIVPDLPLAAHRRPVRAGADGSPVGVARAIGELIERLDLHDVVLVGNDSGGALSQIHAATGDPRLAALVLTNCDVLEDFPPLWFRWFHVVPRVPGATFALAQMMRIHALRGLPIAFGDLSTQRLPKDLLDDWLGGLQDRAIRADANRLLRGVSKRLTLDAAEALRGFGRPIRLVWGTGDRHFRVEQARRLVEMWPTATLTEVPDGRTFLMRDRPDAVTQAILDCVGETVAA